MGLWDEFDATHFEPVWEELNKRFSFPVHPTKQPSWKVAFKKYLSEQKHSVSETEAFMSFGNKFINPILNKALMRSEGHGTFNNLVEYVIINSDKFKSKVKQQKEYIRQSRSSLKQNNN